MFRSDASTSVFALPPGVDFPAALVDGIRQRMADQPPEAMARIQLVVNTRRMARRIRELFDAGPPCLLPRISLVTEPGALASLPPLPVPVSPLRRRLELSQLVEKLLQQQPDLAPRSSAYDLADSLAALIDEMQGEGVAASAIRQLDVTDLSGHWARAQAFIGIADRFLHADSAEWDIQGRTRRQVAQLIAHWEAHPPNSPVILAGSTGSRGTTHLLMQAVARVANGAVVLPGFDFDQPAEVWAGLDDALLGEDHPQFRFHNLMQALDMAPGQVQRWSAAGAPSEARNKLISLALRPAPVTDAWMTEGPKLSDLAKAMQEVTLVEAPTPRAEALSIALRLRQAAETGQTAALITPDRMLTRQVGAALDRWNILPDDSAGLPLHLSPPGRFLRHVAGLFADRLDGQALLTLLKHPLCHDGQDRGSHLLHTRDLELDLRRNGPPFPDAPGLSAFAARKGVSDTWLDWLVAGVCNRTEPWSKPLSDWVTQLRETAENLSAGSAEGATGTIWDRNAGQKALAIVTDLESEATFGGDMTARDFGTLLHRLLAAETVRDRDAPRSDIMIWGTLEARVMGADLLILGGLNENSWPEAADPDPWLNRQMRDQAGLLLPERRIGLAAHDFQQAVGAKEVWLTRSARSDDAEAVPSRWLNRLTNLMQGLPDTGGPDVLADMRARGQTWLGWASQLDKAKPLASAARPSPQPPLSARPNRLSVTEIKRLIRDPYAIYARHVLRLRPLDPLVQAPDALLRGVVVHEILEQFVQDTLRDPSLLNRDSFLSRAQILLQTHVAWPTARKLWLARLERIADAFLAAETMRRVNGVPIAFEARMSARLSPLDFTLVGRADRIDRTDRGTLCIYDYKTGAPPTAPQQAQFDKQLLIEAAVAEQGGFEALDPALVEEAVFIGMGATYKEVPAPLNKEPPADVWARLRMLISAYLEPDLGYTSRRMLHRDTDTGDYDHLARFGEWDRTQMPVPEALK